ncbi:MAG: peptidylprolyl isomerase [Betaproteobacteria bacterium]|nr:peptidylprolyl isomerase [Betaproteobacteria bacterium]
MSSMNAIPRALVLALAAILCLLVAATARAQIRVPQQDPAAGAPRLGSPPAARPVPAAPAADTAPPAATPAAEAVPADRIVAVVNNEVITAKELRARVGVAEQQLRRQNTPLPAREQLEQQLLERLILEKVQMQYAAETGLSVDDAQIDRAVARIAENNRMDPGTFRQALERDGVPWHKFRTELRTEMVLSRLREREIDSRVMVSDAEAENFLADPERAGMANSEFHVQHILVRVPEQAGPEQVARLKAKADEARAKVAGGEDFARTAAAFSDAPDALQGGDLGWRTPERLPGLFVELVAGLKPGNTSAVVRSPAGFHVVRLAARRGGLGAGEKVQQTRVRHILLKNNQVLSDADIRQRLTGLRERLQHGADFAELAQRNSQDGSAAKGGELGWIYPGDTVPDFERAMDKLPVGEISEPVRSPFGWHLIQVLERRVADASEERRLLVAKQALRERKAEEAYQDWLRQLRDRAYVEHRLEER